MDGNGEKPRILIVEDDEAMARMLSRALAAAGYVADCTATAEEALAGVARGAYGIVITDINLPGLSGIEFTRKARELSPFCDIIIMTGDPSAENAIGAIKAGAYDFVAKPFSGDTLILALARCVEKRELARELAVIRSMKEELEAAYSQLRSAERMKEAFLGVVGHELRTPLTPILGGLDLIGAACPEALPPKLLGSMRTGAERLLATINDLIVYAESQKTPAALDCREIDLNDIIRRAADEVSPKASAAGVTIASSYAAAAPLIAGEPEKIYSAVRHLLQNAVIFNRPGGRAEISVSLSGGMAAVRVSDTGQGIPEEQLSSIGSPFYQAADYLTRRTGGLGLGLAIVKQVAESHGGTITMKSSEGSGSVFTLTLPRRQTSVRTADEAVKVNDL